MDFVIHPQLLADCYHLGRLKLCHVLLHQNAILPWFILVPETVVLDLLDLPDDLRHAAMDEAATVARFIKTRLGYEKINFAAIGNVVSQLHLHVVGRRKDDPCWPSPVWGHLNEAREYSTVELERIAEMLERDCALRRARDR
jgi:diadenosine tetraphosphate (Ap4A) HIT family hydrolase